MRKLVFALIVLLLLQACSALENLPGPAGEKSTSTATPSFTPTQTPSRTITPTVSSTPTPRNTSTPISAFATYTPVVLVNPIAATMAALSPTPNEPTGGFASIELSEGRIYYGICKPRYTKMVVRVKHAEDVRKVYLFYRLETAKKSGKTTNWTGTVTTNDGAGFFIYTLRANNIPDRHNFSKAYVHYQFVAENAEQEIIGRTHIYTRNLTLEPCKKYQP